MFNESPVDLHLFAIIAGGIVALFGFAASQVIDPVIVDEAIFASTIRSLAETGTPRYYAGESVGMKNVLWHPPTYLYYVAAWFQLFGASSIVARAATLIFGLLTVPAVALLALSLARHANSVPKIPAAAGSVLIFVTSPLSIQNGTLIDIDGSILALVVVAFSIWTINKFETRPENWTYGLIGIAFWFASIAWVKFGVLPVLLFCSVFYAAYQTNLRRGGHVAGAAIAGLLAFTVSWAVVAAALNLPFADPFVHNFGSFLSDERSVSAQKRVLLSAWGLYTEIIWFSPFLLALGAITVVDHIPMRASELRNVKIQGPPVFLFAIAVLTVVQYAAIAKVPYGFPKYLGIATPLVSALSGLAIARTYSAVENCQTWLVAAGLIVAVGIGMYAIGDPYLVSFNEGYWSVIKHTAATIGGLALIAVVVATVLVGGRLLPRRQRIALFLLIMLLGTNAGILTHQTTADYSTRYFYGVEGTEDALAATSEVYQNLSESERRASVMPVDFGFYIDGPFRASNRYTVHEMESESPPLVVLRTRKYYAVESPLIEALQASDEYESRRYGSYLVFRNR